MTPTDTETIQVRAHNRSVKRLGDWTTARRFDVRASRGLVVLDLMLPAGQPDMDSPGRPRPASPFAPTIPSAGRHGRAARTPGAA
jgi:hypothetical protein